MISSAKLRRQAGMALVVTLSLIVLVTIAVMAFFARATANRAVESSRANQVLAGQLAETAQDYVVGRFLSEMTNNAQAFTNNGVVVYQVTNAVGMVPLKSLSTGISSTDATNTFANLVRQSVPTADANASSDSTSTAAQNGRLIGTGRWNAPLLNFGAGFTATSQLPNWIYVNRDGTATATASTNAIGRFAYNVYDTGGLLDANVAGNPGLTGTDLQAVKGTLAGADLSVIPGIDSTANATKYVKWRNLGLTNAAYVAAVTNAAANGFLNFSSKSLVTRQDLIRLAETGTNGISTKALPFLTHSTRSANAPSSSPITPAGSSINYAANSGSATSANRFVPDVRVKNSFTRRDGTTAKVGESLLKTRFPLDKLALLTPTATATDGSEIEKYFGLTRASPSDTWIYRSGALSLLTLEQVSALSGANAREPDFFELLKAGILSGSLGKASQKPTLARMGTPAVPGVDSLEGDADLQIVRTGACIIDQADSDNYPTEITFASIPQQGIEDLPYLDSMMVGPRWHNISGTAPNFAVSSYAIVWIPKLSMPHAQSTASQDTSSAVNPQKVRVKLLSGIVSSISQSPIDGSETGTGSALLAVAGSFSLTDPAFVPESSVEVNRAAYNNFRGVTKVLENQASEVANPSSSLASQLTWWNGGAADGKACGFVLHKVSSSVNITFTSTPGKSGGFYPSIQCSEVMIAMEYFDGTQWRVYDTLAGNAALAPQTGIGADSSRPWDYGVMRLPSNAGNISGELHFISKWDPRTARWGPCHGWGTGRNSPPPVSGNSGIRRFEPFSQAPADDTGLIYGLWPEGKTGWNTAGTFTLVPGSDGVFRPNDAKLGVAANPFQNLGDSARRPVILQRPFRSVGELGYAFRDNPWQTLNLFDELSGDSALLDLFAVSSSPEVVAGRVNLNSASAQVIQAILSGTAQDADGTSALASPDVLAGNFVSFRNAKTGKALLGTTSLPAFLSSSLLISTEVLKRRREAIVRSLADVTQTRTWNLMADLVAQSGRLGPSGFVVDGERREWIHLALDRNRRLITDIRMEPVSE